MTDEELLKIVGEERKRSIGFGEQDNGELASARERALRYYRGDVTKDIPSLANRSQAVSTDVAEAIETVLPDVMEIFIGGDDVATFTPQGEDDEDSAREESEFVRHVIFTENPGFLVFNTAFKDALLVRTGLFHWRWEDEEKTEEKTYGPMDAETLGVLMQQVPGVEPMEQDGAFIGVQQQRKLHGKVHVEAWPPEDFAVAVDTVNLRDATYCVARSRPRVQDLIARGVSPEIARALKPYTYPDQQVPQARDEAGENYLTMGDSVGDLRQVEIRSHYIRLEEGGELNYWRIDTDSEETVLISKEQVSCIPFGAITPYINSHRFYGESVADKLIEVQKIKTTLLRMFLDDGYFALNQRMSVDMTQANEFTISDLLRNEPNMPVRTKGPNAVAPLRAGGLNFDALAALEYTSVMGEQRTGIVRNAQGLNPDSLHETAKGAMALISAAQKRVRYIARVFAETGVKDLIVGVHDLLRSGYGAPTEEGVERANPAAKLATGWKEVEPGSWKERCDVDVQIGIGSAGREQDAMFTMQLMEVQQQMAMGGLSGITVTPENIYNAAIRLAQTGNVKNPKLFFSDPKEAPPQEPKPDPEMAKVQGQLQLEQAKAAGSMQLEQAKGQAKLETDAQAAQQDYKLSMAKLQGEMELKRYQIDQELQLKREQLVAELQLKRELGMAQTAVTREVGHAKVNASTSTVEAGGEPG
jgi:hypothetical protein